MPACCRLARTECRRAMHFVSMTCYFYYLVKSTYYINACFDVISLTIRSSWTIDGPVLYLLIEWVENNDYSGNKVQYYTCSLNEWQMMKIQGKNSILAPGRHLLITMEWHSNRLSYRIHSNSSALSVGKTWCRCIVMGSNSDPQSMHFLYKNHWFHVFLCAKSLTMKGVGVY